jgi:hypothetical protein
MAQAGCLRQAMRMLCAAALFAAAGAAGANDAANAAAVRFLAAYQNLRGAGLTGLPERGMLRQLAPHLTPGLRRDIEAALREQRRCRRKFPDDKPPWIEGDLFSSNFEGFTAFRIEDAARARGEVPVAYEYVSGKDRVEWRDVLTLKRIGDRWRLDNVTYRAPFQFTSGFDTDLRASLRAIPACGP